MYTVIPAITGKQLIKLLKRDGWEPVRKATHGISLTKCIGKRKRVTVIQDIRASLPQGTLRAILSTKQTGIGKRGLLELLNKYGI